jgi:hypothetical protein
MMSKNAKAQQAQDSAREKGFLYLSIANEFISLVADDLRQSNSLICRMDNERRGGLMDSIACLMEDADDLLYQGAGYDRNS